MPRVKLSSLGLALVASSIALPVLAQQTQGPERAEVLSRLSACRAIATAADRLSCFDREALALDDAERAGQVLVVDRAEIDKASRDLFGLNLPRFTLFSRLDVPEAANRVETQVREARRSANDDWIFELADETVWRQIDDQNLDRARPGDPVVIRRAAMGTYFLSVNGARSLRVRRQQ